MKLYFSYLKKSYLFIFLLCFSLGMPISSFAFYQESNTEMQEHSFIQYKGKVLDKDSKKPLVFASLNIESTNISTVTNSEGEYVLKITKELEDKTLIVSFLGYKSKSIRINSLDRKKADIKLEISITELTSVNISIPKDAKKLVAETLKKKGENYFTTPTLMTAFYRETIKKRRKNVSLSEAVVNIYKSPYNSNKKDFVELYKARKSTDYSKLDTLALKLQGGPFNTLYIDIMKYPQYIFTETSLNNYDFTFNRSTKINNKIIFVIDFVQKKELNETLYKGKLYIAAEDKILTSAVYSLNIKDKNQAASLFVRKKPRGVNVWPKAVSYRVDYREKNGLWYYGYSNILLEFKVKWDKKLFSSTYKLMAEMAITDWKKEFVKKSLKPKERLKSNMILSDEAIGFSDPNFWGEYNIIEPEKSIESAIKKIQRQLKKVNNSGASAN